MKRLIDFVLALLLLVVLAPVIAMLVLVVWLDVGTPVLFRQVRPGLHARPFTLVKFRTMRDSPDDGSSQSDEQRLTPFGRFLRATRLDELPELWNVLRGEMSFVGPRPLLMKYLPLYTDDQMRRHEVRPGLTGWAQINGNNALDWEDKLNLDVWYVNHRSTLLDVLILLRTPSAILTQRGVSHPGSATMPEFEGNDTDGHAPRGSKQANGITLEPPSTHS